ncbi:cupin domain-containing protein [Sphingomonas sp.]|uniref:cupin domain-containing protein n=1 Tax=Sphingomonas sp. TaxID=28214 RepID=UPI003B3AB1FC
MQAKQIVPIFLSAVALAAAIQGRAQAQAGSAPAAANAVVVRKLFEGATTNSGDPIVMPAGHLQATVSKYVIPVGASLPVHKHLFPRYGYLISGALEVTNAETGHVMQFASGQFVVEDVQKWHRARNMGHVPVELLVIDFAPPGQPNTVLQKAP